LTLSLSYLFFVISLGLPLFVPFVGPMVFLILDDLLDPFLAFGLLTVLQCVLDSKFKLYAFYC
jgi:hypothetical protein